MQPLNALDAISPALNRTKQLLVERPFRAGRAWKLCACAYLVQAGGIFIPFPLFAYFLPDAALTGAFTRLHFFVLLLIPFVLYMVLFYLGNRMGFVEFEVLVTGRRVIGPMWNRYGSRMWPWMGLKMLYGTAVTLLAIPLAVRVARAFIVNMPPSAPPGVPAAQAPPVDPAMVTAFMESIFSMYALLLGVMLLLKLGDTLLNDFALPFYTLEDLPIFAALDRAWQVVRRAPGQVVLYLFGKVLLALAGGVAMELAVMVCLIPLALVGLLIWLLVGLLVHGPAVHLLMIPLAVLLYAVLLVLLIGFAGASMCLLEAYAVYFLGGRYSKLGEYLQPAAYTYAPPPLPPLDDDEDDGPSLPMNPAMV